jgi:hypothetical protein
MKVAVFSESPADEDAIRVLVDAVLDRTTSPINKRPLRPRGWPSVLQLLPAIIRYLHYSTKADGLVVVADSDDTPVHLADHDKRGHHDPQCRLCRMRQTIRRAQKNLRRLKHRPPLKTAVGLAVPAVEGWYLCGQNPNISEAAWIQGLATQKPPYTRRTLKKELYGTIRPSLRLETRLALEQAKRLARDINALEDNFPNSFAPLAKDLRDW